MQSNAKDEPAGLRQRHVITRDPGFHEPTPPLELCQRPAAPVEIDQVGELLSFAHFNRFRDQGIVGRLVSMADLRNDLSGDSVSSCVTEHDETDKLTTEIRCDERFAEEVAGELSLDRVEVLPIVPEAPALSHRRLVEDLRHSADELVIV